MVSPSRQHNFIVRVSRRYIVTAAECGRSRHRPSLGAPAVITLGCSLSLSECGCSRHRFWALPRVWAPLDSDDLYLSAHVCWVVNIIRHSGFYSQPWARTHELDLPETGSDIVEAGYCDTSQHCWQSLNEDWAFIVDP